MVKTLHMWYGNPSLNENPYNGYVTPYVQMDCSEHPLYMAGFLFIPFHTFWFNHDWLVVSIPLKNMLVSWDDYSIPKCFWKVIQNSMVPVTTNQNNIINHYPW